MQLQSHLIPVGKQVQKKPAKLIIFEKQATNLASSDYDTLVGLTELVDPVHVNHEKEKR